MNTIQPHVSALAIETQYEIAKITYQQHSENIGRYIQHTPDQSNHASKRERARAEFNFGLRSVNRVFRDATLNVIDPDACAEFVRNQVSRLAMNALGHDSTPEFKEGVRKLVCRYSGIDFDFSHLSVAQIEACLTVLQESRGGHLKKVSLDFSQKDGIYDQRKSFISKDQAETLLLPALKSLAENHPRVKTTLGLGHSNLRGTTSDFSILGAVAELDLEAAKLDKRTVINIFRGMKNSSIKTLNLTNAYASKSLDAETVQELAQSLQSTRSLTRLDIGCAFATNSGNACARVLATTLANTAIEHLDLSENEITSGPDETSGWTPIIQNLPQVVKRLDLSYSTINEKLDLLASKLDQHRMAILELAFCNISGQALENTVPGETVSVAHKLLHSSLQSLSLESNTHIGESGAIAIARALPGTDLKELDLRNCGIADEGFQALASAMSSCNVAVLNLGGNALGPLGAHILSDALKDSFTQLISIDFRETGLDADQCHRIAVGAGFAQRPIKLVFRDDNFSDEDHCFVQGAFPLVDLQYV